MQNSSWLYFPSLIVTEEKVCNHEMKVSLAFSCPNFEVKYDQQSKIKDSVFGHLHLILKGTCARSKHKPKRTAVKRTKKSLQICCLCFFARTA